MRQALRSVAFAVAVSSVACQPTKGPEQQREPKTEVHRQALQVGLMPTHGAGGKTSIALYSYAVSASSTQWTDGESWYEVFAPSLGIENSCVATISSGILKAGGNPTPGTVTADSFVYDGWGAAWTPTGPLNAARTRAPCVALADGRVVIGSGPDAAAPEAEIFDPATNTWSMLPAPASKHSDQTPASLPDGRMLFLDGQPEIFDPVTWSFHDVGTPANARTGAAVVVLTDGKVLIAGGTGAHAGTAQLFDPGTETFSPTAPLITGRTAAAGTMVETGKALITGGRSADGTHSLLETEVYDELTDSWTPGPPLLQPREDHGIVGQYSNFLFAAGGNYFDGTTLTPLAGASGGEAIEYTPCHPTADCGSAGASCGTISDGCGGVLACGDCSSGEYCWRNEPQQLCQPGACQPATCSALGDTCGSAHDGCGGLLSCGSCSAGSSCASNVCTAEADLTASWDAALHAPRCGLGRSCDSGALLNGRGPVGPEPNAPNTLADMCPDGTGGSYHASESIDSVKISAPFGGLIRPGAVVRVDATVWAYSWNRLDVYVTPSVENQNWTRVATVAPSTNGSSVLSAMFVLPQPEWRPVEAIRLRLRDQAHDFDVLSCDGYPTTDYDDLAFEVVQPEDVYLPQVDLRPIPGSPWSEGPIDLSVWTFDNNRIALVQYYVTPYWGSEVFIGQSSTPPFGFTWDPSTLQDGMVTVTARVFEPSGRMGQADSEGAWLENHPPEVVSWSPADGETVSGIFDFSFYATDGNMPVYQGELLIDGVVVATAVNHYWDTTSVSDGAHQAKVRVTDDSGKVTVTAPRTVIVDNSTVVVVMAAPSSYQLVSGLVPIVASVNDPSVDRVMLRDGLAVSGPYYPPNFTGTWDTLGLPDGMHDLYLDAYAGTTLRGVSPVTSVYVQNSPSTSITSPAPWSIIAGTVAVSVDATVPDPRQTIDSVELLVDGVAVATDTTSPYAFSWSSRTVANGTHTLRSRATAGQYVTTSFAVTVTTTNDFVPPSVSLTAPSSGALVGGSVMLAANASDTSGIAQVAFYVDGVLRGTASAAPYQVQWNSATASDGNHTVLARATDGAGNTGDSSTVSVTVDNTLPSVVSSAPASGATLQGTVSLQAAASDLHGITSVEWLVDGAVVASDTTSPYAASWSSSSVADGTHTIAARATDGAGNVGTTTAVSVTVDNDPPSVAVTAPAEGALVHGPVIFSAGASDAVGVTRVDFYDGATAIGSSTSAPYSVTWQTTSAGEGSHALTAVARDAAGHATTSAVRTVTVDNAPSTAVTAPAEGAALTGNTSLAATASALDGRTIISVEFLIDGAWAGSDTSSPFSVSWNSSSVANGSHSVVSRATDNFGFVRTSASVTFSTANDFVAPSVAMTSPSAGSAVRGNVTVSATASDSSGITEVAFYRDGAYLGSATSSPYEATLSTFSVADGSHSMFARATDGAGNTADSATVTFTVDNTAPAIALTAPANGAKLGQQTVTVSANASDNAGVTRVDFYDGPTLIGSDGSAPYSVSWSTVGLNGAHQLTSVAFDAAGNSTPSQLVTVTVVGAVNAAYDATLKAPKCAALGVSCDTGPALVLGRGNVGPEPNKPNTINASCADGNSGTFHASESVDRVSVAAAGGAPLLPGASVTVSATIWATNANDRVDVWRAPNAASPSWTLVATLTPTVLSAASVVQTSFTLPAGTLQAVRVQLRRNGSAVSCSGGNADDRDDLVFATQ